MRIIAIYPGRFQPPHIAHKASYDYLVSKFGAENVYISMTDKIEPPKSPFSFNERKAMLMFMGIPKDKILQVKQQYNLKAVAPLLQSFDMNVDKVIFAISRKDMLSDPRFNKFTLNNGQPAYLQPAPEDLTKAEPAVKHGYLYTVPTKMFSVLGSTVKSASGLRALFAKLSNEQRTQFITDLYGKFDPRILAIFNKRLSGRTKLKELVSGEDVKTKYDDRIARANVDAARRSFDGKKLDVTKKQDIYNDARRAYLDTRTGEDDQLKIDTAKQTMDGASKSLNAAKDNLAGSKKRWDATKKTGIF
jgi:hypothetical protein